MLTYARAELIAAGCMWSSSLPVANPDPLCEGSTTFLQGAWQVRACSPTVRSSSTRVVIQTVAGALHPVANPDPPVGTVDGFNRGRLWSHPLDNPTVHRCEPNGPSVFEPTAALIRKPS